MPRSKARSLAITSTLPLLAVSAIAQVQMQQIELPPPAVGSGSSTVFTVLPTANPALFGLTGNDVRRVNFDFDANNVPIANGTLLTNQYAAIGVVMNGIRVSTSVYQGPASPPNATWFDQGHVFTFTVPVVACGVVNTSPDHDLVQLWSGPNGTGTLLHQFRDLEGQPINYNVDRFVGGRALAGSVIGSMTVGNASGNLELDELIFEVCPPVSPVSYGAGCPGSGSFVPDLVITGCPRGGQALDLSIQNALGGSLATVIVGFHRASLPLHGSCSLLVGSPAATFGLLSLGGSGAGTGTASVQQPIPVGITGLLLDFQAGILDPAVAAGYVVSGGREVAIL